jgi:hypothetical protein
VPRRWLVRTLVVLAIIGFIAAIIGNAIRQHQALDRPRISKITGDAFVRDGQVEVTRLKALAMADAGENGSFRLRWDDGTTLDVGEHGRVIIAARGKAIQLGPGDVGVQSYRESEPLTIAIFGAVLTVRECRFTAHVDEHSLLHVFSGSLSVTVAGGDVRVIPAGTSLVIGGSPHTP